MEFSEIDSVLQIFAVTGAQGANGGVGVKRRAGAMTEMDPAADLRRNPTMSGCDPKRTEQPATARGQIARSIGLE